MMQYYLIGPGGERYGPADPTQLSGWAAEGRLLPDMTLESVETGQQTQASTVPGIAFPGVGAQAAGYGTSTVVQSQGGTFQQWGAGAQQQYGSSAPLGSTVTGSGYGGTATMEANNSGTKGPVPPEVESMKWSWGAFALSWIWLCAHKMVGAGMGVLFGFLALSYGVGTLHSPGLSLLVDAGEFAAYVYLGIAGNKLAWQNRQYQSIAHFQEVEGIWTKWGIGLFILSVVFIVAAMCLGGMAMIAAMSSSGSRY